ncbi:MAG: hypothetical protein Q9212_006505 [Teloschistes hypoglaucus]
MFAIAPKQSSDLEADEIPEIEVGLANIYKHVTPSELERFEHKEWEKDIEREGRKRKVGRPRKNIQKPEPTHKGLGGLGKAMKPQKPKKPLGRPRKKPLAAIETPIVKGGDRVGSNFHAVLIQSPKKRQERDITNSSSSEPPNSSSQSPYTPMADSDATLLNVDQVTPSNATRVVGDTPRRTQPSPSKKHLRPSLMVEAALGAGIASDDDRGISDAIGSEDELTAASPNIKRRVAHKANVPPPRVLEVESEAPRQRDVQPNDEPVYQTTPQKSRTDGDEVRKSMTPHFPSNRMSARRYPIQSPSKRPREGASPAQMSGMKRDADEIFALLYGGNPETRLEDHTIPLKRRRSSPGSNEGWYKLVRR